jgi:phosphoribosylformylglycinamidine (FGAM) synthase-like amidotransferase family enzyme
MEDEMTGDWRKLRNEELHKFYSSPSIIRMITSRRMKWTRMVEKRSAYRILVGNLEGRKPLGRPRSRWENNIKIIVKKI